MELHLKIVGCLLIPLALLHLIFPRYFKWRLELQPLSLINRQIFYVHTLFIALSLLLMGLLCLTAAHDLASTALGRKVTLGLGIFWAVRLLVQFWGYSPKLWKGKRFETLVHIIFSFCWIYFCIIFFTACGIGH